MDNKTKIQQLWRHLQIQDDMRLIIQSFNYSKGCDEYFVAEKHGDKLIITVSNQISEVNMEKPFQLVKQIGLDGKHVIPSVRQIIRDKEIDY